MKTGVFFSLAVCMAVSISCSSVPGGVSLPPQTLNLVQNAVFEVVLEKPVEDSTVYEKELDWEKIPYAIRTDKYYSIGTAFAISPTELITAFHVINLGFESRIYNKYYIRDSGGKVFEVDQVVGGSREKDFLVFTVKDRTFSQFFQFERNHKTGDPVYSIGNALGEGIVVRNGLVLGTVPEEDSGRWNLLKSSADGNPGNSGGPLVTPAGKVVALVAALRENILYSIPAEVILDSSRASLPYRLKLGYGHLVLANNGNRTFEFSVPLPDNYIAIRNAITAAYQKEYVAAMESLFSEAPEYLTGPNNRYVLNATMNSIFPYYDGVDPDDNEWSLMELKAKSYNLNDDGRLMHAAAGQSDWNFYKINKPKTDSLEQANKNPRYSMDLILQNIRLDRPLGGEKYRILSFGDPEYTASYTDARGRNWLTARWLIEFADEVLIMYLLPLPNGPAIITTLQDTEQVDVYEWDIKKICDHTWTAYMASFDEWNEFLANKAWTPGFLGGINFRWRPDSRQVSFTAGDVSFSMDNKVFDWSGSSELFLAPSPYMEDSKVRFDVRRAVINRDMRGKEYLSLVKRLKPDSRLGTNAQENWNDVLQEKFPFDGKAAISAKDNTGSIGAVLKPRSGKPDTRYTLYLSMENPGSEDNLNRRFSALKQGVSVGN
ncbi:MAG: serine protease [Treponema sp.]|nr:serine protease [Treponema sp.]